MGVPVIINSKGWDRIVPLELNSDEESLFQASADSVRQMNQVLFDEGVISPQ